MALQHNIPSLTLKTLDGFVGRTKELVTSEDYLNPHNRTWLVAVHGIGGVGKTTFALKAAWQVTQRNHYDVLVWSTAKTEGYDPRKGYTTTLLPVGLGYAREPLGSLDQLLDEVFRLFGARSRRLWSPQEKMEQAYQLLRKRRTLIVIDDFENLGSEAAQDISEFVGRTLPEPAKAIITARRSLQIPGVAEIHLEGLPIGECERLIKRRAQQWKVPNALLLTYEDIVRIHNYTNGNPLALELTVARLTNRSVIDVLNSLAYVNKTHDESYSLNQDFDELTEYLFDSAFFESDEQSKEVWLALSYSPHPLSEREISQATNTPPYLLREIIEWLNFNGLLMRQGDTLQLHPLAKVFGKHKLESSENLSDTTQRRLINIISTKNK